MTGGVFRHVSEVNTPGIELNEEQHIPPSQEHRIDGEEVGRDDRFGLRRDELRR
jgi:hypothetical protein